MFRCMAVYYCACRILLFVKFFFIGNSHRQSRKIHFRVSVLFFFFYCFEIIFISQTFQQRTKAESFSGWVGSIFLFFGSGILSLLVFNWENVRTLFAARLLD